MLTIYKYPLTLKVPLPKGAIVLSVTEQGEKMFVYSLVDPEVKEVEMVNFRVFGTGHEIEDIEDYKFLGTVKLAGGALMFHVFYEQKEG